MTIPEPSVQHTLWGSPLGLDFTIDGRYLATAEDNGIVRIYAAQREKRSGEAVQLTYDQKIEPTAVACEKSIMAVGSGTSVHTFSIPDGIFQATVARHTLPVTCLAFSKDGNNLASGSADHGIKLVTTENEEVAEYSLDQHNGIVYSLYFDPWGRYLASLAGDGTVIVWDIDTKSAIKSLEITRSTRVSEICKAPKLSWSPNGKYLGVCGSKSEILLLERSDFKVVARFEKHSSPVTSFDWSSNAKYVASASDRQLCIWEVETRNIVFESKLEDAILYLRWQPNENTIAVLLANQQLKFFDQLADIQVVKKSKDLDIFATDLATVIEAHDRMQISPKLDDESEEMDSDIDDFVVDDDEKNIHGLSRKEKKEQIKQKLKRAGFVTSTPIQSSFQPGSTPKTGEKNYLAFNVFGVVFAIDQELSTSYHIEFNDRMLHRPIQFTDTKKYTFAALSKSGVAFCSSCQDDEPGSLFCQVLGSLSSRNTWSLDLLPGEEPKGLAIGSTSIVLVTNDGLVRVLSIGGIQLHSFSSEGVFLCINAFEDRCMIASHVATPFNGIQQLQASIYDLNKKEMLSRGRLPITPKARLSWIGFSNKLLPLSYDTAGVLRAATIDKIQTWTPILDVTKLQDTPQDEHVGYFAVGMLESTFVTMICRGARYPGFPRHAVTEIECKLSVLGSLEEVEWATQRYFIHSQKCNESEIAIAKREIDKKALKLVQLACQASQMQKALDITAAVEVEKTIELASRVAEFNQMPSLAEKMRQILEKRVPNEDTPEPQESISSVRESIKVVNSRPENSPQGTAAKKTKFNPFSKQNFNKDA